MGRPVSKKQLRLLCIDDWEIKQRLIRLQLLTKAMTGEEIAREIVNTVSTEYGIHKWGSSCGNYER